MRIGLELWQNINITITSHETTNARERSWNVIADREDIWLRFIEEIRMDINQMLPHPIKSEIHYKSNLAILCSLGAELKLLAFGIRLRGTAGGTDEWIDEKKWPKEFFGDVALRLQEGLLKGKELENYLNEKLEELIGNTTRLLDQLKDVCHETPDILACLLLRIKLVESFFGLLWEANKEISDEE